MLGWEAAMSVNITSVWARGDRMLKWFHVLMPKEERFFELFARHSDAVLAGAEALRAMLEGGAAVKANYQTVMDREHDADDATREVEISGGGRLSNQRTRGKMRTVGKTEDS